MAVSPAASGAAVLELASLLSSYSTVRTDGLVKAQSASRGWVQGAFKAAQTHTHSLAVGETYSFTFRGLPSVSTFSAGPPFHLYLSHRDNSTGGKSIAYVPFTIGREGSGASAQVGTLQNLRNADYSTTSGNVVVSFSAATDGTTLTVQLVNGSGHILQMQAVLEYFNPSTSQRVDGFACWGDSLTLGGASPYPAQLSTSSNQVAANLGVGGESSEQIAARMGAVGCTLVSSVSMPTSGAVSVTLSTGFSTAMSGSVAATIAGVSGLLSVSGGALQFTRSVAGAAMTVPAGTNVFFDVADAMSERVNVIWAGTNDRSALYVNTLSNVLACVARVRSGKWIVLGPLIDSAYGSGSAQFTALQALETTLSSTFGSSFYNIRSYLASAQALTDAGLTATGQDTTDIANGVTPTQLRIDTVHLTTAGYGLVATKVLAKAQSLSYA